MAVTKKLSVEELKEWMNQANDIEGEVVITYGEAGTNSCGCELTESKSSPVPTVTVKSLSDQPNIMVVPLNESSNQENIWYVNSYEVIKDTCYTGKIDFDGTKLLMNICESGGSAKVDLLVEVDGKLRSVPFKLDLICNNDTDYDMIVSL